MPLHHWNCGILLYTSEKDNVFQFILNKYNDKICTIQMCSFCSFVTLKPMWKWFPQKQMSVECNKPEELNLESRLCCYQQQMEYSDIFK